eukprot:Selendium_serpulae@DN2387_c0_g1_i2.p2
METLWLRRGGGPKREHLVLPRGGRRANGSSTSLRLVEGLACPPRHWRDGEHTERVLRHPSHSRRRSRVRVEQDELGVNRFRRLLRWRRREKMRSLQHTAQSHHLGWWKGAAYRRAKAAIQGADSDSATTTTTGYEKDKTTDNPIVGSRYQLSPTNKKTTDSVLPTIVTRMTPRQLAMNFKRREELVSNLFVFSYLYYSHFLSILCGFDK